MIILIMGLSGSGKTSLAKALTPMFNADYTIWMDTKKVSRFEDTDKIFETPKNPDFIVTHFDADMWAYLIKQDIQDKYGNLGPHR